MVDTKIMGKEKIREQLRKEHQAWCDIAEAHQDDKEVIRFVNDQIDLIEARMHFVRKTMFGGKWD